MAGARREVAVMQVVGLDPVLDEATHEGFERARVVVDAAQEHALAHHRDAGIDQAGAGRAGGLRELTRMVGVKRHVDRAGKFFEGCDEGVIDAGRFHHRHAGVEAQHLHMRDRAERRGDGGESPGREGEGIAAGQHDLPDVLAGRDVGVGVGEFRLAQRAVAVGAHPLAAEAEAAIDRADVERLQQHPVGIAVDEAGEGAVGVVADRVGALVRGRLDLFGAGNELAGDGVGRVGRVDQLGHVGGERDRVAGGDAFEGGQIFRGQKPGFRQGTNAFQRALLPLPSPV